MPGIDNFTSNRGTFGFATNPQVVDLPRGVNIFRIRARLTAAVTVAGGAADGALVTEGIQRFLSRIRVVHDGTELVQPIDGRQLYQLNARNNAEVVAAVNLAAPGVQAATPVSVDIVIPFAADYLVNPIDTVLPGTLPVRQELAVYFEFNQAATNAASGAGTGSFVTGGDRTVTLTGVSVVWEVDYSTTLYKPLWLRRIITRTTEQITAANANLPMSIVAADAFDGVLFRYLNNVNQDAQAAGIANLTFQGGGGSVRYLDNTDFVMMQRKDLGLFPGVATIGNAGTAFWRAADQGKLGSVVVPRTMPDPRFLFNAAAPTVAPGFVQATFMSLFKLPGVTRDL